MSIMRSFRFPEDKLALLREIAEQKHDNNQTEALLEAISRYHGEIHPPALHGYIRIDRVNDVNGKNDCPGCGSAEKARTWVAVYSDGTLKGGLCDDCVDAGKA
jgi:hypothetical protein